MSRLAAVPPEPPAFLVRLVGDLARIPTIRTYLRDLGRSLAARALAPTPPAPWVEKIVMPLAEPLTEGLREELERQFRPAAVVGALGVVASHSLTAWIGYRLGLRSRRAAQVSSR